MSGARPLDALARLVARSMGVSIAVVLVEDGALRVSASHGLSDGEALVRSPMVREATRAHAVFALNDASRSARFGADPIVAGPPHAKFVVARRLQVPRGLLLLLDPRPGPFDEHDHAELEHLAALVEAQLERGRHGLSSEELAIAFPFGFVLDRSLRIVHGGRALAKICQSAVYGASFEDTFLIRRPAVEPRFEALASSAGTLFVLESTRSGVVLRGSLSLIGGGETLVFLGSPWLTSAADLERVGLHIADFALHDPALDLLQLLEGRTHSITELKELNAALAQAKARAEDARRATGAFLAHMSHELRTPMNAVLGMATLVLDTTLSAEQRDYVETICSSGEHLLSVVNDVLDFSKIESGRMTTETVPFSPLRLIDDALELVALGATRKGLEIAGWTVGVVPPWLLGDPARIRQILLNLLGNAVKFTSEGRVASIARYDARAQVLEIAVEDTGIGVDPQAVRDIFLPFTQADSATSRRFGGTGLGLTISRRLAELMEGSLDLDGEAGRGARFVLRVPARPSERGATSSMPSAAGRSALLLEVEPDQRRATHQRLTMLGTEVCAVASTEELRQRLAEPRFDVVVVGAKSVTEASAIVDAVRVLSSLPIVVCVPSGARIEQQGVRVVSRPAELTRLARALAEATGPKSIAGPPIDRALGALRVLLVEDDLVNQRVASLLLARLGVRCDVVGNGHQAVDRVARRSYDVVFMDIQMPELDGIEATRRIRALPIAQPAIVALSASTLADEREACFAAGATSFLAKPLDPDELQATLVSLHAGLADAASEPPVSPGAAPRT